MVKPASKNTQSGPPTDFAKTAPPTELLPSGGDLRLLAKQMDDLNKKFDHLSKPPPFRVADIVALAGAIIALAVFVMSSFALSDRIEQSETRISKGQEVIAGDVRRIREDLSGLNARAAVLEDRQSRAPAPK